MIHLSSTVASKGAASSSTAYMGLLPLHSTSVCACTFRHLTHFHIFFSIPDTSTQSITPASSHLWLCTGSPRWRWRPTRRPACLSMTCGDCLATKPLKATAKGEVTVGLLMSAWRKWPVVLRKHFLMLAHTVLRKQESGWDMTLEVFVLMWGHATKWCGTTNVGLSS